MGNPPGHYSTQVAMSELDISTTKPRGPHPLPSPKGGNTATTHRTPASPQRPFQWARGKPPSAYSMTMYRVVRCSQLSRGQPGRRANTPAHKPKSGQPRRFKKKPKANSFPELIDNDGNQTEKETTI